MKRRTIRHLLTGAGVLLAALVCGYLFFVLTPVGQALDNQGYFGRGTEGRLAALYDGRILGAVQVKYLAFAAGVILVVAFLGRAPVAGMLAVGGMATAIAGAEVLKRILPRPDLASAPGSVPPYFQFDTYPSGHTTVGTSVALALLMVLPARWRAGFSVFAGFAAASYATGVLLMGWHRPSDAIGGIAWSGFCMAVTSALAVVISGHPRPHAGPARWRRALVAGIFVIAVVWAAASFAGAESTEANAVFVAMMIAIVTSAFGLAAWYSRVLETVDWHSPRR